MSSEQSQAALFESLCEEYAGVSGVTVPEGGSGFGSRAIKINKSIFAMLVSERLVVKLPSDLRSGALEVDLGDDQTLHYHVYVEHDGNGHGGDSWAPAEPA